MDLNFNAPLWEKACKAWDEITSFIGFGDIRTAFQQGYYVGYKQAKAENEKPIKTLDKFGTLFNTWMLHAYESSQQSKGTLDDCESHIEIFRAAYVQDTTEPTGTSFNEHLIFDFNEPLEQFLEYVKSESL